MGSLKIKIIVIILFFNWITQGLFAQKTIIDVQHFGVEEGLSHRLVRNVFQDSRGLIWLSTENGLNRFDGYEFKWFTREQGLSSEIVREVFEDARGWLWVCSAETGKETGWDFIDLLNIHTLEVRSVVSVYPDLFNCGIKLCVGGNDRPLYVTLENDQVFRMNRAGEWKEVDFPDSEIFEIVYVSSHESFWMVQYSEEQTHVLEINDEGEEVARFTHPTFEAIFPCGEDAFGQFWYEQPVPNYDPKYFVVDSNKILHPFHVKESMPQYNHDLPYYGNHFLNINPVDNSIWWMINNTFIVEDEKGDFQHLDGEEFPLPVHSRHVFFDKTGKAWIASLFGIYRIGRKPSLFNNYLSHELIGENAKAGYECRGIYKAKNDHLFINTQKGCFHLSPEGEVIDQLFENHQPKALLKDKLDRLWLGYDQQYLYGSNYEFNGQLKAPEVDLDPNRFLDFSPWAIYQDTDERLWFGGILGAFSFLEKGSDTFERFNDSEGYDELKYANTYTFNTDKENQVWFAGNKGLYRFDPLNKKILDRYSSEGKGDHFIPVHNIHHFHIDKEGVFWLATGGGGLIRLMISDEKTDKASINIDSHQENRHYQSFTKAQGLSSNVLYAVYEDAFGFLWMSSDYGLIRFDKETHHSISFLPKDGLPHYEFNRISHFQSKNGRLFFGSLNGVSSFLPKDFQQVFDGYNPPMVLLNIDYFDGRENKMLNKNEDYFREKKVLIRPGDRMINLDFSLLTYEDSKRNLYAWKIEGLDEFWHYQKRNDLNLSGLPYGDYTIRIRGQDASGKYSKHELSIPLKVIKPFYLTLWFLSIILMIFSGLAYLVFSRRTSRLEKQRGKLNTEVERQVRVIKDQNKQLHEKTRELSRLDRTKSRFFANVSHEFRTPLTLLLGPIGIVLKRNKLGKEEVSLLKKAQRNGRNIQRLIDDILNLSKLESGKLSLDERVVDLYPLFKSFFSAFESRAFVESIGFSFAFDGSKDLKILLDQDKLEKIVFNYLSNAFKFTPKTGSIHMLMEEEPDSLRLSVKDSGRGIPEGELDRVFERYYQSEEMLASPQGGTGIGLSLVKEYAGYMNGKVWVESTPGKGSTFYFEWQKKLVKSHREEGVRNNDVGIWNNSDFKEETFTHSKDSTDKVAKEPLDVRDSILVVEDNPDMRYYIKVILQEQYHLIFAEDGKWAQDHLKKCLKNNLEHPENGSALPSLVLSDVMMPRMDGFQFLTWMKSEADLLRIPVVFLTARADIRDKMKGLRIGVDDYLLKPFNQDELLGRIGNLIDRYKVRMEYASNYRHDKDLINGVEFENKLHLKKDKNDFSVGQLKWLEQLETVVRAETGSPLLSVDWLADEFHMSTRQLQRKLKALTGFSPYQYIREVRLLEGRALLEKEAFSSIHEVAKQICFSDLRYFKAVFKKRFGKSPEDYFF